MSLPKRLEATFDNYRETGKIKRDPRLEVAAKALNIPYVEAHNIAAAKLDKSFELPKELYEKAIEIESLARNLFGVNF